MDLSHPKHLLVIFYESDDRMIKNRTYLWKCLSYSA